MSSGWRHLAKNAVSAQTSARLLFALALAPATPREQVKNPRPSQTHSCDPQSHFRGDWGRGVVSGRYESWAMP